MEIDWVSFGPDKDGKDRYLNRKHLEEYSIFYQDMVKETGSSNIDKIDMPAMFGSFSFADFAYLSIKLDHEQDSELYAEGLLLADALDMESFIQIGVKYSEEAFNSITDPRIFKIYFKYCNPYSLLYRMKNSDWKIRCFAEKHLDEFIQEEKKREYPSNMTLYKIFDKDKNLHDFNLMPGRLKAKRIGKWLVIDDTEYEDVEREYDYGYKKYND